MILSKAALVVSLLACSLMLCAASSDQAATRRKLNGPPCFTLGIPGCPGGTPTPTPASQPKMTENFTVNGVSMTSTATTDPAAPGKVIVAVTGASGAPVGTSTVSSANLTLVFPKDPSSGVTPVFRLPLDSIGTPSLLGGSQVTQYVLKQLSAAIKAVNASGKRRRLLDDPGCDVVGNIPGFENDCNLGCCYTHDVCFQSRGCVISSWLKTLCEATPSVPIVSPIGTFACSAVPATTAACVECNVVVATCIASRCSKDSDPSVTGKCYDNVCLESFTCLPSDNPLSRPCDCKTKGKDCADYPDCNVGCKAGFCFLNNQGYNRPCP